MNGQHVGKRVAWGKPRKEGTIMARVPAKDSAYAIAYAVARAKHLPSVPRFQEDRATYDRYLVRTDPAGRRKASWHTPRVEEVEAALLTAEQPPRDQAPTAGVGVAAADRGP